MYVNNKKKVYIYNNGLGLLPQNLTNYCDLNLVLEALALHVPIPPRAPIIVLEALALHVPTPPRAPIIVLEALALHVPTPRAPIIVLEALALHVPTPTCVRASLLSMASEIEGREAHHLFNLSFCIF